jgi:hypothetical protein
MDILIIRCQRTVRWLYDYILIRIYTWNHSRSDWSCMCGDHVQQAPSRRLETGKVVAKDVTIKASGTDTGRASYTR